MTERSSFSGCGKERRILIGPGDLPRQHPFGTTLRFIGPMPADSRQLLLLLFKEKSECT